MPNEAVIRLSCFIGIFAAMAAWEVMAPRRPLTTSKARRWAANLSVTVLNTLVGRLLVATSAVAVAAAAVDRGWGLLPLLGWPVVWTGLLAVILFDLILYLQHLLFHAVPVLWRVHMMHHADLDVDVTTGARFHPVEILLSIGIKLAAVALLGAPPGAVLIFEVLLNGTSMFNHSNVRMPGRLDRALRWLVVTPDMHRIHHSVIREETNSNFGFNLPWWDRLLGTYRPNPAKGQLAMTLGLDQFRDPTQLTLLRILLLPFVGEAGNYPLSRGGR